MLREPHSPRQHTQILRLDHRSCDRQRQGDHLSHAAQQLLQRSIAQHAHRSFHADESNLDCHRHSRNTPPLPPLSSPFSPSRPQTTSVWRSLNVPSDVLEQLKRSRIEELVSAICEFSTQTPIIVYSIVDIMFLCYKLVAERGGSNSSNSSINQSQSSFSSQR